MDRIAVCPGSFDPVTLGHIDVIRRTAKLFDKVIVVVMSNYRKKNLGCFTPQERVELIERCIPDLGNVTVDYSAGLLVDYARSVGACAIVKGLRAVSDFEDEFQQALTNKNLAPEIETVFVTTSAEYMFLSSSVIKQVCELGGDIGKFVSPEILDDIVERVSRKK
ncbi:MAG: pantetheine-phosphate adenylyltransferase [Clostridia bacterium]|nr:pantetheine-phosphate adenylyltransferase [Clostridia bacterium]